jgi:hypothetical protein
MISAVLFFSASLAAEIIHRDEICAAREEMSNKSSRIKRSSDINGRK